MKNNRLSFIVLSFSSFIIFITGLYPTVLYSFLLFQLLNLTLWWHWMFIPLIIYFGVIITLYSELLVSGAIVRLFHIYYKPGEYSYCYADKNAFKWILICTIYTPFRKILEIFPVGTIKNTYYRLMGMKIGSNTLVGGVIKDPCMTSFGDNTTMGEYALIYAHITDYTKGTITIKPVHVGNNCVIGAGAIIMPGATIEDNVMVAAGALITQGQHLQANMIYAGVPATPLSK